MINNVAELKKRHIWSLAWPIILSNISVPMLAAVDTAVVGRLPNPSFLGAVAVGGLLFSIVFAGFNFLRMGTTGLTAQAAGAGDCGALGAWLLRSLGLSAVLALVVLLLQKPLVMIGLTLVSATPSVTDLASSYFGIRVWAFPASLVNMACLGWLLGLRETRFALLLQVFLNGINMALDIYFVLGLQWGVAGAALATVTSEYLTLGLSLFVVRQQWLRRGCSLDGVSIWDRIQLRRMMGVNRDIFLRSICLQASFFAFTSSGARLGELALAANAVLMNLHLLMSYGMDGLANVAEIMAGEALGAKDPDRLRHVIFETGRQCVLVALLFSLAWFLGGEFVVGLLTDIPQLLDYCGNFIPWLVVMPLVSVWCFHLDGVFIGTTHTRAMRNSMALSLLIFIMALFFSVSALGNHGLWLSFTLFMGARGVTMALALPSLLSYRTNPS